MANFNSGKSIFVVVQCQKADEKEVSTLLDEKASLVFGRGRYAYILHDKDVLDNGDIKGKHFHIVLTAESAKSSQNWVKHFADVLKVEESAVSVEMQGSEKKCLRYLLHLDDANKHQYDRSEVITNMSDACKKAWEASTGFVQNPTLEQLTEAYKNGAKGLYNLVGMTQFSKAMKVIQELKAENDYMTSMAHEVDDVYALLLDLATSTEAIGSNIISLKDYKNVLRAVSKHLDVMLGLLNADPKK